QHHVRRGDLRSPERDLRRGVRRILRRGDPAAPDRLPADLSAFGWLMAGLRLATTSGKPKRRRWPRPSLPDASGRPRSCPARSPLGRTDARLGSGPTAAAGAGRPTSSRLRDAPARSAADPSLKPSDADSQPTRPMPTPYQILRCRHRTDPHGADTLTEPYGLDVTISRDGACD